MVSLPSTLPVHLEKRQRGNFVIGLPMDVPRIRRIAHSLHDDHPFFIEGQIPRIDQTVSQRRPI